MLFTCASGWCGEREKLIRENLFLESELELSKQTKVYVVVNLEEKRIDLKVKGFALASYPVATVRYWGDPISARPAALLEKITLTPPRRPEIKPAEAEKKESQEETAPKASGDLEALELKDMPLEYTLSLERGIFMQVKNKPKGFRQRLFYQWYLLKWRLSAPLKSLWSAVKKRPYTAVNLILEETDAQSLYWSFPEGARMVVWRPPE